MPPDLSRLGEADLVEVLEELEQLVAAGAGGLVGISPITENLILDLMDEVRSQPIRGTGAQAAA